MLETCEISRILSSTAHPDDMAFAAAGTVARWTAFLLMRTDTGHNSLIESSQRE